MTGCAGTRDLVFVSLGWRNESESVRMDKRSRNSLAFNLRHVTGNALTAGAPLLVVRMRFQSCSVRTVR